MSGINQQTGTFTVAPDLCPPWCVTRHGALCGEEDGVHTSAPVTVAEGVEATTCMSVDPETGVVDGPHVMIGSTEHAPAEVVVLATALLALAEAAESVTRPGAG